MGRLKICNWCDRILPRSEFYRNSRCGGGLLYQCKPCHTSKKQTDYWQDPEKNLARQRNRYRSQNNDRRYENRRRRRDAVRQWVWDLLENSRCIDCNNSDSVVLEFDHRDMSEKKYSVSAMLNGSYALETVQAEVAKCDVRCCNCHRKRTVKQLGWGKAYMLRELDWDD